MKITGNTTHAVSEIVNGPTSGGNAAPTPKTDGLPEPLEAMAMSDDVIAQITVLLAKGYRQDRMEAKKLARLEQLNHAKEVSKRVRELHAKADATRSAALVAGITGMAAGAAQIGAATAPLWGSGTCPKGPATEARAMARGQGADLTAGVLQGGGNVTKAAGELGAGAYRSEGEHCDARAAQHEGNAEAAKRRAAEYQDESEDAKRMLQKVAEFLKESRAAQQGAANAALFKA